jgi:hypothetical protein
MRLTGNAGEKRPVIAVFIPFLLAILMTAAVPGGRAAAQMIERGPAPFAVGVGNAWIIPGGNLPLDDPADGRYATAGTAFTQRLMWAPRPAWGVFAQVSFPSFGVDAAAVQTDYDRDPPVIDGANTVTSWLLGLRWRAGRSWRTGPYVETALGWNRATLEVRQEGLPAESLAFNWEIGWMACAGWVLPVGPTFSLDGAIAHNEFKEDYFTTRWTALRIMAVFTFGGSR